MALKVAFYKGRARLFNRLVSWYLRGPYSHCELVTSEVDGVSTCISSSFMDGGVRLKTMRLDPEHWDLVDVEGDPSKAMDWLLIHEEERYDLLGLLGFFWRRERGLGSRWFCNEAVASMLGWQDTWRFDPMSFFYALKGPQR